MAETSATEPPVPEWVGAVCLGLPDATTDQPFGPGSRVYRVRGRVFALTMHVAHVCPHPLLNLKAQPEEMALLLANHDFLRPGWHMNKKHWLSVELSPTVDREFVTELIEDSYDAVLARGRKPRDVGYEA